MMIRIAFGKSMTIALNYKNMKRKGKKELMFSKKRKQEKTRIQMKR